MDAKGPNPRHIIIQMPNIQDKERVKEDGGKIGRSRVHFLLGTSETPSWSSEEQNKQPTVFQHI